MTTEGTSRAFSSTGKAILAGGYLVLFPEYKAYVVALSARMHALTNITDSNELRSGLFSITINSPQFSDGTWTYDVSVKDILKDALKLKLVEKNGRLNPFVENTILTVITYTIGKNLITESSKSKNIVITMYSDAEYHSQKDSTLKSSYNHKYNFLYHKQEITKVNKTGLGSSAGLVTSLTAALLSAFISDFDIEKSNLWKERVHNLAQVAHCKAQGKVGSGFDVASATFGSIIYQRFEANIITNVLESKENTINKLVYMIDEKDWKIAHDLVKMPPGIRLLMGDVQGGSETPKMVSKVLEWKKSYPEFCAKVWKELDENNLKLIKGMQELNQLSVSNIKAYNNLLDILTKKKSYEIIADKSNVDLIPLQNIITSIKQIRKCLQIMTVETGASIEPESQTQLLDDVSSITGVLGGVVPGAGGYDAICLLVANTEVETVISTTALSTSFSHVRWMALSEQNNGLIEENPDDFVGL